MYTASDERGRAGNKGCAISFVAPSDRMCAKQIEKALGKKTVDFSTSQRRNSQERKTQIISTAFSEKSIEKDFLKVVAQGNRTKGTSLNLISQ